MARPKPPEPQIQIGVKLPESLVRRVDEEKVRRATQSKLKVGRTDVVRIVLDEHLPPLQTQPVKPDLTADKPAEAPAPAAKRKVKR